MSLPNPIRQLVRVVACALILALVAACTGKVRPTLEPGTTEAEYGMVIEAYKNGQFMIKGAVLAAPDLESHFAYLKAQGGIPSSVLLEDGSESTVRSAHLTEFAQLASKYGFTGYVLHKGKLKSLDASGSSD